MDTRAGKLPIHKHSIFPSARIVHNTCKGCNVEGFGYGGYVCNESDCKAWFHKECAEAPSEINHRFHQQHPLLLTNDLGDGSCDLCGQKLLKTAGYSCPTCEFKVDLTCGLKPSPADIEHPICHDHPLVLLKKREEMKAPCEVCKDSIGGPSYSCLGCHVYFHVDCVHLSKEVNHPCHTNHPLKLIASESLTDNAEKSCLLCGLEPENILYHCSICNFTACLGCTKSPPPLVIEHTKTHKHQLNLFPNVMSYVCNVTAGVSNSRAYMCLPCNFMVNGNYINLPQVININRHDHRVSFTHQLGPGYLKCGVCFQIMDELYGAYACLRCPNYAVHSYCAVQNHVWDGVELEGTPEIIEDLSPFKVMGDNLISHFSHHKHTLRLHKEDIIHDESARCEAYSYPIGFDPIYSCEDCRFILHEKCANLPKKKRLVFGTTPFTLVGVSSGVCYVLSCNFCGVDFTGFSYTSQSTGLAIDAHCGSLYEPFVHGGHLQHPLYFTEKDDHLCNACHKVLQHFLRCAACDFDLCFRCASLPEKIRHRNDEHPLTLIYGEIQIANGKYWCDICEAELDPIKWFYTCFDCGVTLHVECILGNFSRLKPGRIVTVVTGKKFEVVLNNHNTRPICSGCHSRCKVSIILNSCDEDNVYICSPECAG